MTTTTTTALRELSDTDSRISELRRVAPLRWSALNWTGSESALDLIPEDERESDLWADDVQALTHRINQGNQGVALRTYTEDGQTWCAVSVTDINVRFSRVEITTDRTAAEARYEELVMDRLDELGIDGWDFSDVPEARTALGGKPLPAPEMEEWKYVGA